MGTLAYQYGLFKLGVPGLVLLGLLGTVTLYRRKAGGSSVSTRMIILLVLFTAGVIALIDGYPIYGGGLMVFVVVFALLWAVRGTGSPATAPDRRTDT